ncbi:hypothetical protein GCK72_017464 [Caenorhabditis remanei]|uniref:DUF38 domain-containing protein n=1 Tax=Caenorhabditis remanei TaxID=31234 RepID=A0A6A5G854_CAERE|nr:hypothetical protein GCK72_017464 [Caenorhabditis remanei]KAF1750913.1 hypothetical protein GCK72_017464 [Caenorhabditis remanei]
MSISEGLEQYNIDEIAEMDQWKQAKHLGLRVYETGLPPIEHFLHFSTIEAHFGSIYLTDVVNLCDSVSK